jgi:leucyl aminopeptidase
MLQHPTPLHLLQVHFITAACENMVSATATHPGDVHVSAAGISVEINDTDAEGRLTLADAVWYAQQQAGAQVCIYRAVTLLSYNSNFFCYPASVGNM